LLEKHPPQIVVDVQGVGYEIDVPMSTFYQLPATGAEVTLHTHLVVREDAHQLYGFASESEREAFRQLLRISGIGARTALAVLSGLSVSDLREAVASQDGGRLTRIPGIGKKTAERLLLELRDKLDATLAAPAARGDGQAGDIANALHALGYNEREAGWAIKQLPAGLAVADGIRQALKLLSKQ
jgi:Holliday junction DNA helicase RuvA